MRRSHPIVLSLSCLLALMLNPALSARAQEEPRPRLEAGNWDPGSETFRVRGRDPGGPRDLVLFRWREGAFHRIAARRSQDDGGFDFGEVSIPNAPFLLGVAEVGQLPAVDDLITIERPTPAPQIVAIFDATLGITSEVVAYPARFEGELRLYDAEDGRLLARRPLDATRRGSTSLDVIEIFGRHLPDAILIRQVLADGRLSVPAYFRFDELGSIDPEE